MVCTTITKLAKISTEHKNAIKSIFGLVCLAVIPYILASAYSASPIINNYVARQVTAAYRLEDAVVVVAATYNLNLFFGFNFCIPKISYFFLSC